MKKIIMFIKKHHKKIICAITFCVIAFCGVFVLRPNAVKGATTTDLIVFSKEHFTNDYFEKNLNSVYSGSNVKVQSSIDFSFGYYTKFDYNNNKAYEYYSMGNNSTTAFMRPAKGNQDNIVISSNFISNEFRLIYSNLVLPVPSNYNDTMLDNINTRYIAFRDALRMWLSYKYLYMEYLPDNCVYDLVVSSVGLGQDASKEFTLLSFSHDNVGGLRSLGSIFNSDISTFPVEYIGNYSFFKISDYVNDDVQMNTRGFFVIPYLSLTCSNPDSRDAMYFVDYFNSTYSVFYDYSFQTFLSSYYLYGDGSINYNVIYNMGYDNGFNYASSLNDTTPFSVILDTLESFLSLEVFPNFPIYYLFLFGVGVTIFSLILKFALGG